MHAEALGGGAAEFDAAVEARACPYLNQLGEAALGEMRTVYEQLDVGNYEALGELAGRLAAAAEQKAASAHKPDLEERSEPRERRPDNALAGEPTEQPKQPELDLEPAMQSHSGPIAAMDTRLGQERPLAAQLQGAEVEAAKLVEALPGPITRSNAIELDDSQAPTFEHDAPEISARAATEQAERAAREEAGQAYEGVQRTRQRQLAEVESVLHEPPQQDERTSPFGQQYRDRPETAIIDTAFRDDPSIRPLPSPETDGGANALAASEEAEMGGEVSKQDAWAEVLGKESPELYADFAEALQLLVEAPETSEALPDDDTEGLVVPTGDERTGEQQVAVLPESEPVPPIVVTVIEHLAEAAEEERVEIAPVLREIIATVQTVEAPGKEAAEPERIEAVMVQLEEQVQALFERLSIEYGVDDVRQFISVLLRSDFQPTQPELVEARVVNLEQDGTREAKRQFAQLISDGIAIVEDEGERLLGRLVLYHSLNHWRLQPAAALNIVQ